MRRFFLIMLMVVGFSGSLVSASTYDTPIMTLVVETVEIDKLNIKLSKDLNGYIVFGKKRLTITPVTKAYKNGVEVPLLKVRDQRSKYTEASYDFKTGQVIRIDW